MMLPAGRTSKVDAVISRGEAMSMITVFDYLKDHNNPEVYEVATRLTLTLRAGVWVYPTKVEFLKLIHPEFHPHDGNVFSMWFSQFPPEKREGFEIDHTPLMPIRIDGKLVVFLYRHDRGESETKEHWLLRFFNCFLGRS